MTLTTFFWILVGAIILVLMIIKFGIKKEKILCQKELNLEKNQKEKNKDKKKGISATYFLLSMVRD